MNPDDPRVNRSKRALLDAGIALLLHNPAASLSEIALHAKVGRATLYRHFETRDQLIQALAKESLEMTDQVVAPLKEEGLTGKEAITGMLQVIMPLADRYHFLLSLWNIAEGDSEVMVIYNSQLDVLAQWVEQGKKQRTINGNFSTSWIVTTIDALIYAGWWSIQSDELTPEQAAQCTIETLFSGIS